MRGGVNRYHGSRMGHRGAGKREGFRWRRHCWRRYRGCTLHRTLTSLHNQPATAHPSTTKTLITTKKTSSTTKPTSSPQPGTPNALPNNTNSPDSTIQPTQETISDSLATELSTFWTIAMSPIEWIRNSIGTRLIIRRWMRLLSIRWGMMGWGRCRERGWFLFRLIIRRKRLRTRLWSNSKEFRFRWSISRIIIGRAIIWLSSPHNPVAKSSPHPYQRENFYKKPHNQRSSRLTTTLFPTPAPKRTA